MRFPRLTLDRCRTTFAVACLTMIVVTAICSYLILPAYDEWCDLRQSVAGQRDQYEKFTCNLGVKQSVEEQFAGLAREVFQTDSDQATYSHFLRRLEMQARATNVAIVNVKPFEVEVTPTYKIYRVRLSVAGKIHQLLQFVGGLIDGPAVVGTESLTIRAVQGINMVECILSVWMVCLTPEATRGSQTTFLTDVNERQHAHAF